MEKIEDANFGIYILTYPGDFHLSTALVESIQYFNPGVPVVIIPGEGFDLASHPFKVPVMDVPGGFWGEMGYSDRKFWAFQGPFNKFLYIDADMICLRNISSLISDICACGEDFVFLQSIRDDPDWKTIIADSDHKLHQGYMVHFQTQIGNLPILEQFDPDFDPFRSYPINSGFFASARKAFSEQDFYEHHKKEEKFYNEKLNKEFSWKDGSVFFLDQGRFNYLIQKKQITKKHFSRLDRYVWGGTEEYADVDAILEKGGKNSFIHWAGVPRPSPSLFCKSPYLALLVAAYPGFKSSYGSLPEIFGYSLWKHFYGVAKQPLGWNVKEFSKKDFSRIMRHVRRRVAQILFG
ncbi:MAG: hypothetical protein COB61_011730 [Thiotrichales bacterium]|nr:hypothetical protein [Thiotrichales bacterium]